MVQFPSIILYTNSPSQKNQWLDSFLAKLDIPSRPNHPDIVRIGQDTGWGIDQIRNLKKIITIPPLVSKTRLIIIEDSQNLSVESQNSLLKILEEPPTHTHFLLITANLNSLLDTIKSRCQLVRLLSPYSKTSSAGLKIKPQLKANLLYSQEVTKNKADLISAIQDQIYMFQQSLVKNPSPTTAYKIKLLSKCLSMIDSNVNPTSALDYFYLSLIN